MESNAPKCKYCEEDLEDISFSHTINGGVEVWLSHKEQATLYVCTSRDCSHCGVVIAIPWTDREGNKQPGKLRAKIVEFKRMTTDPRD